MMEKKKEKEIKKTLPLYGLDGKVSGNVKLDEKLFDGKVNKVLLYEANKMYEANSRKGTASAKTRSEVSGGGAKPWRQKGTGRARVGSSRNPVWTHGGVTFPPKPRDFSYSIPKKMLKKALLSSLNARLVEERIKAVVKIELKEVKTKTFRKIFDNLKVDGTALVVVDAISDDVKRSSRNLKNIKLKEADKINARDVLLSEHLVIEKDALEKLTERVK